MAEIEMTVERGDEELELTIRGRILPAEPDVGLMGLGAEIEAVLLDGKAWEGELTEAEEQAAIDRMIEDAEDSYGEEPDYDEPEPYDLEEEYLNAQDYDWGNR